MTLKNLDIYLVFVFFLSPLCMAQESNNFSDYEVMELSSNLLGNVDYSSHGNGEVFREGLQASLGEKANFAGKYYVYTTGCGTMCQALVVVDIDSGQMVDVISTSFGGCFQENSSLLITNPNLESVFEEEIPKWAKSYYYKISDEGFELLHETQSSFPGECVHGQ